MFSRRLISFNYLKEKLYFHLFQVNKKDGKKVKKESAANATDGKKVKLEKAKESENAPEGKKVKNEKAKMSSEEIRIKRLKVCVLCIFK
jgi:hypothetical protein